METVSIAGREFPVAADADAQRKLGGFENELQANGNGTVRLIKTRVPWSITGLTIEIDDDAGDHEFLQDLADRKTFEVITFTYASGVTYQGTGQVTGEVQYGNQNTTATLSLGGPGKATKQ
jgi:hypothetical protein